MTAAAKLTNDDRAFFEQVARVVFTNPFSSDRVELDKAILEQPGRRLDPNVNIHHLLLPRVESRLERLGQEGFRTLADFAASDRQLMEYVFLFETYHRHVDPLNDLIRQQESTEEPLPVPFALEAIGALARRGFSEEDALRFFSLFYQLRRAYYFIERGLIGTSASMERLRRALWDNVFTHDIRLYDRYLWRRMENFSTLLLGETGTGKGTAAAAIGRSAYIPFDAKKGRFEESFAHTFLSINLSQFPETLIESELFGHRKGAFTGAVENHEGVFSRCSPFGAIFLDEIGEVSVPVQIKMLQVLQERCFSPVGSHERCRFAGRVIGATNRPLDTLRSSEGFRDDFFYRLCSDLIIVPPLRTRVAEDPAELDHLIALTVERMTGEPAPELVGLIREVIDREIPKDYTWPGNVRELEQAARRILLTRHYGGDRRASVDDAHSRLVEGIETASLDGRSLLREYCAYLYDRYGTYEEVARRTELDRRTVRKYVVEAREGRND